jgi:hypothetical protein
VVIQELFEPLISRIKDGKQHWMEKEVGSNSPQDAELLITYSAGLPFGYRRIRKRN